MWSPKRSWGGGVDLESGEIEGRESRLDPLQGKETKNEFEKTSNPVARNFLTFKLENFVVISLTYVLSCLFLIRRMFM